MSSVTIIVPAYNEGAAFGASLTTLADYFAMHRGDERVFHYLIVDDGSSDETFEAAQRFARWRDNVQVLRHERNCGLGAALRTAFAQTKTDMAVVLDADLSYTPAIAMDLVESLERENADIALASAYMSGGSVVNVPFVRRVLSREANRLLSLATGVIASLLINDATGFMLAGGIACASAVARFAPSGAPVRLPVLSRLIRPGRESARDYLP